MNAYIDGLKMLARRELSDPPRTAEFVAPRTSLELRVAKLWEEVLDVRPISAKDEFFALGGNSLHVVRVASRIERVLGKKLPVSALFGGATVENSCVEWVAQTRAALAQSRI